MDEETRLASLPKQRPILAFALVHFPFSLLAFGLVIYPLSPWCEFETLSLPMITAVLLLFYFPLGLLMGFLTPWVRLDTPESLVRAIFTQARVAWSWAALMIGSLLIPGLASLTFILTLLFAFPSCLLVLCCAPVLFLSNDWSGITFALTLAGLAIPAGLLPPLLFDLGCFCVTCRNVQSGSV